jgi:ribosomal protein S18 acetylase RimI-like enzyme
LSKTINNPWIKLKNSLNQEEYELIHALETLCVLEDQVAFKLELDYKLMDKGISTDKACLRDINDFMYFDGEQLIGYIGICYFGGAAMEINGMVHPDYRRQGIFSKLLKLAISECKGRNAGSILALCDNKSVSGLRFLDRVGAVYQSSEFEMYLNQEVYENIQKQTNGIIFRKATNEDVREIARQDHIYFGDDLDEENEADAENGIILPEDEEKRGNIVYLTHVEDNVIGKVKLELIKGITGGIYGLGVLPEYRSKGYGRAILLKSIEKLKEAKATEIMLQVATENSKALNLYQSCGFQETSRMDYFEIK